MSTPTGKIVKKSTDSRPGTFRSFLDGLDSLILRAWRVFVSLKFGIFLLALILGVSIWGTMGYASNAALGDNSITMARTLVFESGWFVALLVLFAANLILSTWHVTVMSVTIWWKKDFRRGRTYYEHGRTPRGQIPVEGGPDAVERTLRRRFTRVQRDGDAFFAHKGILSRLGPTIVHAGIILVVGAMVAKAVLTWNDQLLVEGRFIAAEGEMTNIIHQPIAPEQQITNENRREIPIDVWVRVLDFDEVMHPNSNVPAYFSSLLEIRDPRDNSVTVAQLDMNHGLRVHTSQYGWLNFHQAGYQPVPDGEFQRVNFDVRDRRTGERIAVTDSHPGNRVRIGDTEYFLEVDGLQPADRWRVYTADRPFEVAASGLLQGGRELSYSFRPEEFFPDFRINEDTGEPHNASNNPNNPALRVAIILDGQQVATTWLFLDPAIAEQVPDTHPRFRLKLEDVRLRSGLEPATVDWNGQGNALFVVTLTDREDGEERGRELLVLGEESRTHEYTATIDHGEVELGSEGIFDVRILGPTQRYLTVLTVVNEPTVPYVNLGVVITVFGAMLTFLFRYRAFYGWWDPKTQALRMALVPRWGQSVVQEEFDQLVEELSGGRGLMTPARQAEDPDEPAEEVPAEHESVRPELARV